MLSGELDSIREGRYELYQQKFTTFDIFALSEATSTNAKKMVKEMRKEAVYNNAIADGILSSSEREALIKRM